MEQPHAVLQSSPHGGCGLKFAHKGKQGTPHMSSPPRGMWIEITGTSSSKLQETVIPPRGMWIEISITAAIRMCRSGHPLHVGCGLKCISRSPASVSAKSSPPHGGCGLKYSTFHSNGECSQSSPPRGMWIKMACKSGARALYFCYNLTCKAVWLCAEKLSFGSPQWSGWR